VVSEKQYLDYLLITAGVICKARVLEKLDSWQAKGFINI